LAAFGSVWMVINTNPRVPSFTLNLAINGARWNVSVGSS
jgi:hypothetical protein